MITADNKGDQKGSKTTIIHSLRKNGPVARIELVKLTGLSRATISMAISELIDAGIVHETESRYTTGGRPATLLELTPYSRIVVGADYSDQVWTLGAFDLLGNIVHKLIVPVDNLSPDVVIRALIEHLPPFIAQVQPAPMPLIGLGMPGLVDIEQGIIKGAYDLGWYDIHIADKVRDACRVPVVIMNRHRARGLAECRFGSGKLYAHMVYIGVGTGISSGIFQNHDLFYGAFGGAGDIGHVTVDPHGPLCPCGNHGCLQELASGMAMERYYRQSVRSGHAADNMDGHASGRVADNAVGHASGRVADNAVGRAGGHVADSVDGVADGEVIGEVIGEAPNSHLSSEQICARADNGDPLCMVVVEKAAIHLGIAMAGIINLLNPDAIILGGPIPMKCNFYVEVATKVMHQRAMRQLSAHVVVKIGSIHEMGGALGAANFALDQRMEYSLFRNDMKDDERAPQMNTTEGKEE